MTFKFSNIIHWINTLLTFWIGIALSIVFLLLLSSYAGFEEVDGNYATAYVSAGGILITLFAIFSVKWQRILMSGKSVIVHLALLVLLIFLLQNFQPQPFVYVLQ